MKPRFIAAINRMADSAFFEAVSEGCRHIVDNASRLIEAAEVLAKGQRGRASHALCVIAEEEAAKYLILLDAVRCPRTPPKRRARQLCRFNDHLAKGIYSRAYRGRPATVAEVVRYIEPLRHSHYLDGPNDIDWVFRNEIAQHREEAFYVDYVETDDGETWWTPGGISDDPIYGRLWTPPAAVSLVRALHASGIGSVEGLKAVAAIWRPLEWHPDAHYQDWRAASLQTLQQLESGGILAGTTDDHSHILREWLFPLHDVEMTQIKVDIEYLRERQQSEGRDY